MDPTGEFELEELEIEGFDGALLRELLEGWETAEEVGENRVDMGVSVQVKDSSVKIERQESLEQKCFNIQEAGWLSAMELEEPDSALPSEEMMTWCVDDMAGVVELNGDGSHSHVCNCDGFSSDDSTT